MKKLIFATMFIAANLMFLACDNKQKTNGTTAENDSTEIATADDEVNNGFQRGIDEIRKVWTDKTVKVDANSNAVEIKRLALAFCKAYPQSDGNKALREFLSSSDADEDDIEINITSRYYDYIDTYRIMCNPRNGFICSLGYIESPRRTDACYWNRSNGHKLFAAYMEDGGETANWDQCLVVFYDYDPATHIMTPEPALTKMIEKRVKDYTCYSVELPEEGKDIHVNAAIPFDGEEEDDPGYVDVFELEWNGTTFVWKD